jgi:spermidine/putrescine transport system permease protein
VVVVDRLTDAPAGRFRLRLGRVQDSFDAVGLPLTILWVVPLFVIPFVLLLAYSFASQDYLTAKITFGWTLSAWRGLSSPIVYRALLRSLGLATASTLGCVLLGYPLAYFAARHAGRFRPVALILIIIPFWVSFIIRAYALIALLSTSGPVNGLLKDIHVISTPIQLEYNYVGIAVGMLYNYLPLMVFPLFVAIDRIDDHVFESARDLGATSFSTFRRVTFPQALPGLLAGCTLVWVPALGEYVIPTILGGGKVFMVGNVIAQYFTDAFEWPLGAALSIALVVMALAIVGAVFVLLGRTRYRLVRTAG